MSKLVVALAGLGTIGTGLARLLAENSVAQERLVLKSVLVRDASKPRPYLPASARLVTNLQDVIGDPEIDVVVELWGGVDAALKLCRSALAAGKHVVTANKNLLAEKGPELFALARENGVTIGFEASVCAGIPIIRVLREALRAERILSVEGIVNGTTNYILTRMSEAHISYDEALKEAQEKGYAEPDPTYDVTGKDAACKAGILASLAFGSFVDSQRIPTRGIATLGAEDVRQAEAMGYRIKLIAAGRRTASGALDVEVAPVLLPHDHPLASVRLEYNAVLVESQGLGRTVYSGKGAGPAPTAVSLLADLLDAADGRALPADDAGFTANPAVLEPPRDQIDRYYVHLCVPDKPGVLAKVAGVLATRDVSLASVLQPEAEPDAQSFIPLILTTHRARRENLDAALTELKKEPWGKQVVLRIQDR
ncbi:MAG: homoserine dehydrogenase [Spirochaetales bacterium]|nr:homoserine dehydrogenase [Spirochaetales bacterium]